MYFFAPRKHVRKRNEVNRIPFKHKNRRNNSYNYMMVVDLWVGMDITISALVKAKKDVILLKVGSEKIQTDRYETVPGESPSPP